VESAESGHDSIYNMSRPKTKKINHLNFFRKRKKSQIFSPYHVHRKKLKKIYISLWNFHKENWFLTFQIKDISLAVKKTP